MKLRKHTPQVGERRTRRKFAWLPTFINHELKVWLETYEVVQELSLCRDEFGGYFRWEEAERHELVYYP